MSGRAANGPEIQRWWADWGSAAWVSSGLLVDVDPKYDRVKRLRLDELDEVACVVMLGDGGAGKSWEVDRWRERQKSRLSLHVRGARLLEQKLLFREFAERPDFERWTRGEPLDGRRGESCYTAPAKGIEDDRSGSARFQSSQTTAAHWENFEPRRGSGLETAEQMP